MNAGLPEEKSQTPRADPVTQEKIREFCYELALALRRITGRMPEGETGELPVDIGEKQPGISDKESE